MEQWKTIKDFPCYEVSNTGRIKSLKNNKERYLKAWNNTKGYLIVRLSHTIAEKRTTKDFYVHRLVVEYFSNNFQSDYEVHHIDKNRQNNNINNLICMSRKEHILLHKQEKEQNKSK